LNVYFENNSAKISKKASQQLDSLLETARPGEFFIEKVIGYCDKNGSEQSNKVLASRRIASVESIIRSKGMTIIEKVEAGETYPSDAKNTDDLAYWRRVEIHYSIVPSEDKSIKEKTSLKSQFTQIKIDSLETKSSQPVVLNIQFAPGLDQLIGNSELEIQNLYEFLRANENISAFIRGHVCCTHDPVLSTARAYVVYKKLVDYGISPLRLKYEGFSNTIPAVSPEVIEEHRQANRRVDVIFSKIN
jgi:outer membrane protein OmpA-like peptidoglycan-associated protein